MAERQGGVVHRDQLLALGLSGSAISRWEAAGRIHRLYPAVYAVGRRAIDEEARLRAALLYAGDRAALSHVTALGPWELLEPDSAPIHVSVEAPIAPMPGLVVHERRRFDRTLHRALEITTVPQTLLDVAQMVPFSRLRKAIADAEFRRLATIDEIASVLGRGRPGSRLLRRALALHEPRLARTLSALEERFLALCERFAIPLPEVNVTVCGLMVDALWRHARVVVELDGGAAHGTAAAMERDRGRDLALRAAGFTVLRYTWQQVTRHSQLVARDLRAALHLQPPRSAPGFRA